MLWMSAPDTAPRIRPQAWRSRRAIIFRSAALFFGQPQLSRFGACAMEQRKGLLKPVGDDKASVQFSGYGDRLVLCGDRSDRDQRLALAPGLGELENHRLGSG